MPTLVAFGSQVQVQAACLHGFVDGEQRLYEVLSRSGEPDSLGPRDAETLAELSDWVAIRC